METTTKNKPTVVRRVAGTVARRPVVPTNVVGRSMLAVLPAGTIRITDPLQKPDPVAVMRTSLEPTLSVTGSTLLRTGSGLMIVNVRAADVPPPGDGLTTEIANVPAVPSSVDGMTAESVVELIKAVTSGRLPNITVDPVAKLAPVRTMVLSPEPATTVLGVIPLSVGAPAGTLKVTGIADGVLLVPAPHI